MIGYCCINTTLQKNKITTNRTMTRKTFDLKGIPYVEELILKNLDDLLTILKWNNEHGFYLFRMSSDMFPWQSEYDITTIPNFNLIKQKLTNIGRFILDNKMRVSFHPGPFSVLASESEKVVLNTIKDLNNHSLIMDLMELPQTNYFPINIHVNSTKPNKVSAMSRFCENFKRLSESTQKRLVVENDHSLSQYSVKDLYDGVYQKIGIPITYDQFHHIHGPQDLSPEQALNLALGTWLCTPLTHMSSSRKIEDPSAKTIAHADYIYEPILESSLGIKFDTDIEAKSKELALIKYIEQFK